MYVRLKGKDIDEEDDLAQDIHNIIERYINKLQLKADIQIEVK